MDFDESDASRKFLRRVVKIYLEFCRTLAKELANKSHPSHLFKRQVLFPALCVALLVGAAGGGQAALEGAQDAAGGVGGRPDQLSPH